MNTSAKKNECAGFSLVELMVVVVILGILATVAVPVYGNLVAKSRAAEVMTSFVHFERLQSIFYMEEGRLGTLSEIGFELPQSDFFQYLPLVQVSAVGGGLGSGDGPATSGSSEAGNGSSTLGSRDDWLTNIPTPTLHAFATKALGENCPAGSGLYTTWTTSGPVRGDLDQGRCSQLVDNFFR